MEPQVGQQKEPEPTRGLKGSGLRYGESDGVPSWAIGKTGDEVLEMTQTLYNTVMAGGQTAPAPQPVAAPVPIPAAAPTQGSQALNPPDPNLLYTQPDEYNRQLNVWQKTMTEQTLATASAPLVTGQVEMARAESKRNTSYEEVWEKYAPEIEAEVVHLAPIMKTSPKLWNDAAALIKGRHSEELFKNRLATMQGGDTGTLSTDGNFANIGVAPSELSPIQKAWSEDADWTRQFKRLPGMTLAKLQAQVRVQGNTEEEYVKHYENRIAMRIHNADEELSHYGVTN